MDRVGFIFPGQGAQYVGMGKSFYDSFKTAQNIFDASEEILKIPLKDICFQGPLEILTSTVNCQVGIFVVSCAVLEVLKELFPGLKPSMVAGLSLGEYTSLYASKVLNFESALKLVHKRAYFMQKASEEFPAGMASVIGLDKDLINEVCKEFDLEIANINCPGQIAVSGPKEKIIKSTEAFKQKGAKKVVVLNVSGAFHSRFMESARAKLSQYLEEIEFKVPFCELVSNVSAQPTLDPKIIKNNLIEQMTGVVNWQGCCQFMISQGIELFLEIGPGKVLKGLMRRISPQAKVLSIGELSDVESVKEVI